MHWRVPWRASVWWTVVSTVVLGLAAPAVAQEGPPSAAYVGDSIGVQSQEEIAVEVARSRPIDDIVVTNGAPLNQLRSQVVRVVRGPDAPSILVVGLGHAQVAWGYGWARHERDLRRFLDDTAPYVDCVRWFDVRPNGTSYELVNRDGHHWNTLLTQVAADYPNVDVFHYSTWARWAPKRFWYADNLHMSPRGEWEMGRLVRQAADGCDPALSSGPFWDVPDADPNAGPIAWMHDAGLVDGFANGSYRARVGTVAVPASRAQLASILWRQAGSPSVSSREHWPDVRTSLEVPVTWARRAHVLSAYGDGRFRPNLPVSRGQVVRALWTLADRPTGFEPAPWPDVRRRLAGAAAWANATGLLTIGEDGLMRPDDPVDRGELARMLAPPEVQGPLHPPAPAPPASPPPEVHVVDVEDPILVAPS